MLPATRALAVFILPFLLVAFVLLYFWPSAQDTGRLFAWPIAPDFTSMMLASAYLGGAYFFWRAATARQWHTIAGGFLPVVLFAGLLGVATVLHWDRFIHSNVAFWLWAGLYFTAPLLVLLAWWANRAEQTWAVPGDVQLTSTEVGLIAAAGIASCLMSVLLFAAPAAAATVWRWSLTPLTARVVGAVFALGFAGVQVLFDRRWTSARMLVQVAMIMLGLMLVGVIRSAGDFATDRVLTWMLAVGVPAALIGLVVLTVRMRGRRPPGA